jgi:hypothetical protein
MITNRFSGTLATVPNEDPNYLAHAFKSQYNLIGLGTALGFAVLSGSALPLLIAAGIEMVVLPLVSGSGRFQRLIRARLHDEGREEKEHRRQLETSEMLRALSPPEFQRYRALELMAGEIRKNYRGLDTTSQVLLDELVGKLDFLLGFYLRMRYSLSRYDSYFATTDPERLQERISMLEHEAAKGPERVRQIKAKTRAVLLKRVERYHKAQENRQLIEAQTETVQEVLQLLRDQSYSMRDPRSITEQLDGLISSSEETERGVRDLENLLASDQDLVMAGSLSEDLGPELEAATAPPLRQAAPAVRPDARLKAAPPPPPPPPERKKAVQ